jgi:hypothetical protein
LQVSRDDLEQIVEVVRHATSQFANRLQLLRLLQGEFGAS